MYPISFVCSSYTDSYAYDLFPWLVYEKGISYPHLYFCQLWVSLYVSHKECPELFYDEIPDLET